MWFELVIRHFLTRRLINNKIYGPVENGFKN